jgi:glycosyltransferase involved in cell wall biosynthesis
MDRLRVLQVIPKLTTGGGQRVAMDLVEHLDHKQFEVEIVSLYPFSGEIFEVYCKEFGLNVNYLTKQVGFDADIFFEINKVFRKYKPQVVHNHLHGLYTILPSCLLNKIPVRIHTVHSIANEEAKGLHRFIDSLAFNRLGVLPVSISRVVLKSVFEIYGEVESPVIYNGVDIRKYSFSEYERIKWREQNYIAENAFIFVNVAGFNYIKNQRLLIYAFREVLQYYPSSFLILVGDGEMRQEISSLVEELGISKRVLFTGLSSNVAQLLSASDCFVLSSDWEGLPLSVLEAMAGGKPIIATNVGGVSELIVQSENGLLVPAGDYRQFASAMIELCREPSRILKMGERSRQIAEQRFNVHEMAKQYGELYLRIIRSNNPSCNR